MKRYRYNVMAMDTDGCIYRITSTTELKEAIRLRDLYNAVQTGYFVVDIEKGVEVK